MSGDARHVGADAAPAGAPQWGPWWHDGRALVHAPTGYWVPLADLQTPTGRAGWLQHLREKRWWTAATAADMVAAARALGIAVEPAEADCRVVGDTQDSKKDGTDG